MRTFLRLVPVVLITVMGCATPNQASPPAGQSAGPSVISMTGMRYTPTTLTVKAGVPVRLSVQNQDSVDHDFTVMGMPSKDVKNEMGPHAGMAMMDGMVVGHATPGQTVQIEFTPTQKGSYEFYCQEPGHKEAGMKGTVVVE